jgi:acyl-CoA reductase-like NAD-dependent aldehyde dehydrogenase
MTNLRKRTTAIQDLAQRFAASAPSLIDAMVADFQLARGAAPRHVQEALAYLLAWPSDEAAAVHASVRTGQRRSAGGVAIHIHEDAPLTSFARVVPAAFLSGAPQILVNVPARAATTRDLLASLCEGLPGVHVSGEGAGSFLFRALTDAWVRTIWAGGAADLMAPLEELIEETNSHIIFEGLGNDAIVVADEADMDEAARITARLVFRDGGLDPASPRRVYVPEHLQDAFNDRICAYAAALPVERWTDARCTISPMRSEEAREHINDVLDEAEDAGADLAVGLDFRDFPGQQEPTLYPTVVTGCAPDLRIVTEGCRGPVLSVVPYTDAVGLFSALDQSAGPDGQVAAAVSLIGDASLRDELSRRFARVFDQEGPYSAQARAARLQWGGGPQTWRLAPGKMGLERRYGPVDLTLAFTRDSLPGRTHWMTTAADRNEAR